MEEKKPEESLAYGALLMAIDRLKEGLSFSETDKLIEMLKKSRKAGICTPELYSNVPVYYSRSYDWLTKKSGCDFSEKRDFDRVNLLKEIGLTKTLDMCLVNFDQQVTVEYAIEAMKKIKIRQATPKEMLSLLIKYPEILKNIGFYDRGRYGVLAALGIDWLGRLGSRMVAGIARPKTTAYLTTYHVVGGWDSRCYFVGVFEK